MAVIRWIARVWSIVNVAFVLAFVIEESLNPQGQAPTPIE